MYIMSNFPVPRLFTSELAGFYEGFYKNKGVTIVKGTVVSGFESDESGNVSHSDSAKTNYICYAMNIYVF